MRVGAIRRSDERIAVRVRPGRGQADDHVAGACLAAVDDEILLYHAYGEASEIVVAGVVHTGHFGGLATDQGAARLQAAFHDTRDDPFGDGYFQLAGGVVVEEVERFCSLHHDVVDTHGDEIDADGVVTTGIDGKAQFGAHTVRAGNQHRATVTVHRDFYQRAEAAEAAQDFWAERPANVGLDALDEFIARVDIDAGVAVGDGHGTLRVWWSKMVFYTA